MLLFMDGCDHGGTGSVGTLSKWGIGNSFNYATAQKRTGTASVGGVSTASADTKPLVTTGGAVIGCAFIIASPDTDVFIGIREGEDIRHLGLCLSAQGGDGAYLQVVRGEGSGLVVLATSTTFIRINNWYYFELKAVIHESAGSYEVRIDGVPEPGMSATGVDTRNSAVSSNPGTGIWDRIRFYSPTTGTYFDDIYVLDTSGPAPMNDFLGPVKIHTLLPQTSTVAAGTHAGLTPSTGTDRGALVDENPPNTTDYNGSAVVGAKDTYQFPPFTAPVPSGIVAVQVNPYVAKSDATGQQLCATLRVGSTDHDGPPTSLATTFQCRSAYWVKNPATGLDWTVADIDALQAGIKILGSS